MTVREQSDLAVWLMARDIARAAGRTAIRSEDLYRAETFHGHRITSGRPR